LVWLVVDKSGKLQVTSTQNQDNPLMKKLLFQEPILALVYGNMPTILVINTEEKLHRFFFQCKLAQNSREL
jgi:superoxide dismutase